MLSLSLNLVYLEPPLSLLRGTLKLNLSMALLISSDSTSHVAEKHSEISLTISELSQNLLSHWPINNIYFL